MSDVVVAGIGLCVLALIFLANAALGMRRRKRLWFVGSGQSSASRVAELRALQMRELRDLEDGHAAGKIDAEEFVPAKEALLLELAATNKKLQEVESAREKLKNRFNLNALILVLGLLIGAPALTAQAPIEVSPQYRAAAGVGRAQVEIRDSLGLNYDLSEAVLVAIVVDDFEMPFNERTQASWTGMFRRVADIEAPSGLGKVRSIDEPGSPTRAPYGYAWRSNSTGSFEIGGMKVFQRLAFAAYFQGMWWPMLDELVLESEDKPGKVLIEVNEMSTDLSQLQIDTYRLDVRPAVDKGLGLRWHQVQVEERIEIDNKSSRAVVWYCQRRRRSVVGFSHSCAAWPRRRRDAESYGEFLELLRRHRSRSKRPSRDARDAKGDGRQRRPIRTLEQRTRLGQAHGARQLQQRAQLQRLRPKEFRRRNPSAQPPGFDASRCPRRHRRQPR